MGLFNFGGLDVAAKVDDFERILTSIATNLETLVALQRDQMAAERVFRDSLRDPAESWPR